VSKIRHWLAGDDAVDLPAAPEGGDECVTGRSEIEISVKWRLIADSRSTSSSATRSKKVSAPKRIARRRRAISVCDQTGLVLPVVTIKR
jgi:hypothetical protein